jgi:hypothetical protein
MATMFLSPITQTRSCIHQYCVDEGRPCKNCICAVVSKGTRANAVSKFEHGRSRFVVDGFKPAPQDAPGLETFTILATEPNALCAPIHNRMPVMLAQDD